jgi:mannose-6-phosphate isomerase-like protein (cupin superfamily)
MNHRDIAAHFTGPDWPPELVAELQASGQNEAVGSRLVSEEAGVRVWHLHIPPGARLPFHRHSRDYFWTVLGPGRAKSRFGDGQVKLVEYQAGDTKHFALGPGESFIHDLENIGETDLVFVTVERI